MENTSPDIYHIPADMKRGRTTKLDKPLNQLPDRPASALALALLYPLRHGGWMTCIVAVGAFTMLGFTAKGASYLPLLGWVLIQQVLWIALIAVVATYFFSIIEESA